MLTVSDFLLDFQGEETYADLQAIFATLPSDSTVVSDNADDQTETALFIACSEIQFSKNIPYLYLTSDFTVASSPNGRVFRITWPSDLVSSPYVYVITDFYLS